MPKITQEPPSKTRAARFTDWPRGGRSRARRERPQALLRAGLAGLLLALGAGGAAQPLPPGAPQGWTGPGGFREWHVTLPPAPSPEEKEAAALFQELFEAATRREIGASASAEGAINVLMGGAAVTAGLLRPDEAAALGEEEVLLETYTPSARHEALGVAKQFILAYGTPESAAHAVHVFFREYLGMEWFAPDQRWAAPLRFSYPEFSLRQAPGFRVREVTPPGAWAGTKALAAYRAAHHLPATYRRGPFGAETLPLLAPAAAWGETTPEIFAADAEGLRAPDRGYCLSAPVLAEIVADALRRLIDAPAPGGGALWDRAGGHDNGRTWSVTEAEDARPCLCPECAALREAAESGAAPLLVLLNRVAAALTEAYPGRGLRVHGVFGGAARTPPRANPAGGPETLPRPELAIQLRTAECDFSRPLDDPDSPVNAAFRADLGGWSRIADALYIWDHAGSRRSPFAAFPNLAHLQRNIHLYDQYFVEGVYFEGWDAEQAAFSEWDALRGFLLARLLWNPDADTAELKRVFLQQRFERAAPAMSAYIDLLAAHVQEAGVHLDAHQDGRWFNADLVDAAQAIFDEALSLPLTPEVRRRVQAARIPVWHAAAHCPPRIAVEEDRLRFTRPPMLERGALEELLRDIEGGAEGPAKTLSPASQAWLDGGWPPREEAHAFHALARPDRALWVAPGLHGAAVRWREQGIELLHAHAAEGAGLWTVWRESAEGPAPLEAAFEVAERHPDRLRLVARLANGLELTQEFALTPDGVRHSLRARNASDRPIAMCASAGPALHLPAPDALPAIYQDDGAGGWTPIPLPRDPLGRPRAGMTLPAAEDARWAIVLPGSGARAVFSAESEALEAPRIAIDAAAGTQSALLLFRLLHSSEALAPDEERTLALHAAVLPDAPDS